MRRIVSILLIFFAIIGLGAYAVWRGPAVELTSWQALDDPGKYAGMEISGGYNRVVGGEGGYLTVAPFGHKVVLKVSPDFIPERGEFLSYNGRVNSQGYIDVEKIYLHKERGTKYFLSLIPLVIIMIWFARAYKFNWRKFYFEESI
ncbi:MAG: hypothetical protein Q8N68_03665 [bacterium]|nr:hypothetical protein [bacterium]